MHYLKFLSEFVTHPGVVGAVAPSSRALARVMMEAARIREARNIVEFGPGTGVFTRMIEQERPEKSRFFALETNPRFVELLGKRLPEVPVVHDSAENAERHLPSFGMETCDSVVSGLPWATFGDSLQDGLLETVTKVLRPGGRFVTFAYLQGTWLPAGIRFRRKLEERFAAVDRTPTVWWNLPPAFVYIAVAAS